jgi:hypothetical protein
VCAFFDIRFDFDKATIRPESEEYLEMDSFPKDGPVAKAAHEYLDQYKGLDFLVEFYEIEHLQSIEDAVDDLIVCCQNNGGCHDNRVAEGNVWVAEGSNLLPFRFRTRS